MLKPYPLAPERYLVSDDGKVYGCINSQSQKRAPNELKPHPDKAGYLKVSLRLAAGEESKSYAVHRLVLETFLGPRPDAFFEVGHSDGNRLNNSFNNLRWVTRKENAADRELHGKTVWGERATRGKMTEEAVLAVAVLRRNDFTVASIARMFNVSRQTIHAILNESTWKRLKRLSTARDAGCVV